MPNGNNQFLEELLQRYHQFGGDVYDYSSYAYSGLSPEIMQALGNVFNFGDIGGFTLPWMENAPFDSFAIGDEGIAYGSDTQLYEEGYNPDLEWYEQDIDSNNFMESALGFTNVFDPESLAATLSSLAGIDPDTGDPIRAGEVKVLTPEMIEKTTSAYYSPYEESERESLVEKLGEASSEVGTGGFAGSGARTAGLSGAERLYRGGYEDLLGDIMKMRSKATGDVLDTIYGWQELMDA